MQERENVHRGGGAVRCAAVLSGLLFVFSIAPGSALGEGGSPARSLDWIVSDIPAGRLGLLSHPSRNRFAGLISTLENPYLIEGLVSSNLLAGFGARSCSAWLDWYHLGHELYREDRVSMSFGFELPFEGLGCVVTPAVERRAVKGFAARRSHSLYLSTSYECGRSARVAVEGSLYESPFRAPRDMGFSLELHSSSLAVAFDRTVSGERAGDTGLAVEVRFDEACSFLSGYRSKADELSTALIVRGAGVVLCLSWRQNPALGSSLGAVVGRVWKW